MVATCDHTLYGLFNKLVALYSALSILHVFVLLSCSKDSLCDDDGDGDGEVEWEGHRGEDVEHHTGCCNHLIIQWRHWSSLFSWDLQGVYKTLFKFLYALGGKLKCTVWKNKP